MLNIVSQLNVPQSAKDHRFVAECVAAVRTMDEGAGVLGTDDLMVPELFGWQPNVHPHVDMTGFVYFMPIIVNGGFVCAGETEEQADVEYPLQCGTIYRLNDCELHWTRDDALTVGLFLGSYEEPDDDAAVTLITAGLAALAAGDYYNTPRAGYDFRVVKHDECLVDKGKTYAYKLLADAIGDEDKIVSCSQCGCGKPAVVVDRYFPSFPKNNLCAEHVKSDKLDVL